MSTKNTGATLSELIIVLALMCMIFSATAISVSGSDKTRLQSAAVTLQSDLRYIRKMALNESISTRIVFDADLNCYELQKESNSAYVTIKTVELNAINLDFINAAQSTVEYTPRATTNSACTIEMSTGEYKGILTVNVGSGRIKITEISKKQS